MCVCVCIYIYIHTHTHTHAHHNLYFWKFTHFFTSINEATKNSFVYTKFYIPWDKFLEVELLDQRVQDILSHCQQKIKVV